MPPCTPCLHNAGKVVPSRSELLHEIKCDGYRLERDSNNARGLDADTGLFGNF